MKVSQEVFLPGRHRRPTRAFLGGVLLSLLFTIPVQGAQSVHKRTPAAKQAGDVAHGTPPPPVQLCVVVRNVRGEVVDNLHASDFRLWDNNRLQRITDFAANIVPPPVEDLHVPGTVRYTALYFDDLHFDFTDTIRVTDSAYSFFKHVLGPRSKIGIFTSSGEITLNFTDDATKLHQALLAIRPHIPSARDAKACPPLSDFQAYMLLYDNDPLALRVALDDLKACDPRIAQADPPGGNIRTETLRQIRQIIDSRARQVISESETQSQKMLEGLDRVITTVATLPDPRSIIVASPGFLGGSQSRQIDLLARRATRLHIIVSALDTTGLIHQIPAPAPTHNRKLDEEREAIVAAKNQMLADRASMAADPLLDLATMTGGNFIANKDDLESGFKAAIPLPAAYYVLGYYPSDSRENGSFHNVRISVVRHGLMGVQAPSGYYAPGTPAEITRSSIHGRHSSRRRK
jgi:VWFA-related protein